MSGDWRRAFQRDREASRSQVKKPNDSLVAFPGAVTKCRRLHFGLWFKGAVHLSEGHHGRNMSSCSIASKSESRERDTGAQQPTFLMGLPISVKPLRELLQDKPTGMSSRYFSVQWCWQSRLTTTLGKASWDFPEDEVPKSGHCPQTLKFPMWKITDNRLLPEHTWVSANTSAGGR